MSKFHPFISNQKMHFQSKIILILSSCLVVGWQASANAGPQSIPEIVPDTQIVAQRNQEFLVLVNGNSDALLAQVRQVVRDAFQTTYRGRRYIQAGLFNSRDNAEALVRELEDQFINANIERLGTSISSYSPNFPDDERDDRLDYDSTGYFVVIPAPDRDLRDIEEQVRRLALREDQRDLAIRWRYEPRGSHVIVGPFDDREIAERWNLYLKDFGLGNARVYYGD